MHNDTPQGDASNCSHNGCSHHGKKCGNKCGNGHTSQHSIGGGIWIIGWLFTIGYLHLSFWYGVLAILVWPFFLGTHFGL